MNELALFAGGGGGIWASLLLGHTTVCAVEIVESNRRMLLQRQIDGMFPRFPIWDDVRTFDGNLWRGKVDIVSGGFPCQDISCAGNGSGLDGARSGLWSEFARIIREVRPRYAFIENSPMLVVRGLNRVLADLAAMGFNAEWGVIGAHHVGAHHERERIWIVAHAANAKWRQNNIPRYRVERKNCLLQWEEGASGSSSSFVEASDSNSVWKPQQKRCVENKFGRTFYGAEKTRGIGQKPWPAEPGLVRMVHGVANQRDRIFALGNGQVPRVAATAWRILSERFHDD